VVNEAPTTIALFSSANPATVNEEVSFEATISAEYGGEPAGSVVFFENGTRIGSPIPLTGASAVLTTTFPAAGTYNITAAYTGDGRYLSSSTATPLEERVAN
jgi:hypothetical protein